MKIIEDLIKVATGEIDHDYHGLCPDSVDGFDKRDDDCPACQIIMKAERHLTSRSSRAANNCPKCGKPLIMGVCETGCGYIPPPA